MSRRISTLLFSLLTVIFWCGLSVGASDPVPLSTSPEDRIQILPDGEYGAILRKQIDLSKSEILVSMYLFRTDKSRSNPANRIQEALGKAAKRGVAIKVLLEREEDQNSSLTENNRNTARMLESQGIRVFFDPPNKRTHTKVLVIDRRYAFIGSHNLTRSALQSNHELSVMIASRSFAEKAAQYVEAIIHESEKK
jgi:phosphatidylserine/phosphatidylglycerophosphate/cardiolipin synthase-like enzyme